MRDTGHVGSTVARPTTSPLALATATPMATVEPAAGASPAGTPLSPPAPLPLHIPSATALSGATGCGAQSAGQGVPRTGAAAATAVLGASWGMPTESSSNERTAPVAGSTATTATDPATRPD
ncbi:hypothetical protein DQ244_08625 [Blastococcus sp. TBT05-19]|nr:hypothetical protein DQ244_08625 [Blastococcus sp. TBT05-19]